MKKLTSLTIFICIISFLYSCEEENIDLLEEENTISTKEIDVRETNGYLVFKNRNVFDQINSKLSEASDEELSKWDD